MATFQRGSKGLDVTRIEIRLKELGLYTKGLDDVFGGGLETAVQAFQRQRGLPATGVVDPATWDALFADPSPRLDAVRGKPAAFRSLALTAAFETSAGSPDCFCGLTGNFDGQGMSFGVLQWNLGQGTLQPLLKRLNADHPQVVEKAFGDSYDALTQMLGKDRAGQMAWADTVQGANKRTLAEPWRTAFKTLGRSAECQEAQVKGAADRYDRALDLCRTYGLWSERGAALMFDIVVQNGSIGDKTRQQILKAFDDIPAGTGREAEEVARMRIVANRRAEAANPKFVEDVRSRKLTIANGVGIVHGLGYDVERQYDLKLVPFETS